MIFGDSKAFAIESEVLKYYPGTSPNCLGFFVIHLAGVEYGVREYDASMLGNSFTAVRRRLRLRGSHVNAFPNASAIELAQAVDHFLYHRELGATYCGADESDFDFWVYNKEIIWAPDGDEAFDDGSHVLQFDEGSECRLVGFRRVQGALLPQSVSEVYISADAFYGVLASWLGSFEANWRLAMSYEN